MAAYKILSQEEFPQITEIKQVDEENIELYTMKCLLPLNSHQPKDVAAEVQSYLESLQKTTFQDRMLSLHDILLQNEVQTAYYVLVTPMPEAKEAKVLKIDNSEFEV